MKTRFEKKGKILDIVMATVSAMLSVIMIIYGILYFGGENEFLIRGIVMSLIYLACVTMIWMYFFNILITTRQFNYWCSLCIGVAVLIRDILFLQPLRIYPIQLAILTLAVLLVCMITYFYARKDWKSYTKRDLWMICVVDVLIALLYNTEIYLEPFNKYTDFFLVEIWIRPTITYGLVACYIMERK